MGEAIRAQLQLIRRTLPVAVTPKKYTAEQVLYYRPEEIGRLHITGDRKPSFAQRVLFFSAFPLGSNGSGTVTRALMNQLRSRDRDVAVLHLGHKFDGIGHREYLIPVTHDGAPVLPGAMAEDLPVFATNPSSCGKKYQQMNALEIQGFTNGLVAAFHAVCKDFEPDAIVVNHMSLGMYAAGRMNRPYVAIGHGTCADAMRNATSGNGYAAQYARYVRRGLRNASHFVAITPEEKAGIERTFQIPSKEVSVIPNGYDAKVFYPDNSVPRSDALQALGVPQVFCDSPLAVFAGRMVEWKGVADLLSAAQILHADGKPYKFLLAGGGNDLPAFQAQAKESGLLDPSNPTVHFLGHRTPGELVSLFRSADVGVVPSHEEPFGIVPLEIAACGVPLVVSDVGGLRLNVTPEVGVRVPPRSAGLLASAIDRVLSSANRILLGETAAQHVKATFSWDRSTDALLGLLDSAVDKNI